MSETIDALEDVQYRINQLDRDFGMVSYDKVREIIEDVKEENRQ